MERYVNILYRLARFLAGIPPELLGALILVVLWQPAALVAPVVYVANVLSGEVVVVLLLILWNWIIWPRLPYKVQAAILQVRDYFLPAPSSSEGADPSKNAALEARVEELERRLGVSESAAQGNLSGPPQGPTGEDDRSL